MARHDADNQSQGSSCASRHAGWTGRETLRSVFVVLIFLSGAALLGICMYMPIAPIVRASSAFALGLLLYLSGALRSAKTGPPASIRLSLGMMAIYLSAPEAVSRLLPVLFETGVPPVAWIGVQLFLAAVLILPGIRVWQLNSTLGCTVSLLLSVHLQAVFLAMPAVGWIKWAWFMAAILLIAMGVGHLTLPRRRTWIQWVALLAVYSHLFVFCWYALPESRWQWISTGAIGALAYLLLTAHSIEIASRRLSLQCAVRLLTNTVLFGIFAWIVAGLAWPGREWAGIALTALLLCAVAMLAAIAGGAEPVVTFLLAKGSVAAAVTLVLLAPPVARTPMIAGSAIIPLVLYGIYRAENFRLLALLPVPLTVLAALLMQVPPGQVFFGPIVLNQGNASLLGAIVVLVLLARWYAAPRLHGAHASRMADMEKGISLTYAAAAALIMMVHTILSQGDPASLPMALVCQALVFAGLGMVLAVPAVIVCAMMPLTAVAAYFFSFPPLWRAALISPVSLTLSEHVLLFLTALGLAAYTECWLRSDSTAAATARVRSVTELSYFPAWLFLLYCVGTYVPGDVRHVPVVLNSAAFALYLFAIAMGLKVLRSGAAILMLIAAFAGIVLCMRWPGEAAGLQWYVPALLLLVVEYLAMERLSCRFPAVGGQTRRFHAVLWISVAVLAGTAGLYDWNSGPVFHVGLLGFAACFFVMGRITRERVYHYCAAMLAVVAALGLIFFGGRGVA